MSKAEIAAQIEGLVKIGETMPKCVCGPYLHPLRKDCSRADPAGDLPRAQPRHSLPRLLMPPPDLSLPCCCVVHRLQGPLRSAPEDPDP